MEGERRTLTSEKPWKNCRMSAVVAEKGNPRITKVPGRPEPLTAALPALPAAAAAAAAKYPAAVGLTGGDG